MQNSVLNVVQKYKLNKKNNQDSNLVILVIFNRHFGAVDGSYGVGLGVSSTLKGVVRNPHTVGTYNRHNVAVATLY